MALPEKYKKPYDHGSIEPKLREDWESSGFANPDRCMEAGVTAHDAEKFSMVLPPPNVTGVLHTGHALMLAIQDIMVRHARMTGKKTLWLPGTDHAAIATQAVVEKQLAKDGVRRADIGREGLLAKIQEHVAKSRSTITSQVRAMGASVDWSREAFTLDDARSLAVRTAFKKMYDDGLIYRKEKVVNWDPKGQTTISDDEIVYEERPAKLYTFKYAKDFPIPVATTRPETKVGDTAVAVHPEDERYAKFIGQTFEVADFCGASLSIKIVGDAAVEREFGTGAVGVTPAHSQIDAEIAARHGLPSKTVIDQFAKMVAPGSPIDGLKAAEAREKVAEWLEANGLMVEPPKDIKHNVATAERTGGVIEPRPMLQWWINVNAEFPLAAPLHGDGIPGLAPGQMVTLKQVMLAAVQSGHIKILPGDRFERVYYSWIKNLRDWCISRQIWYGHRIPVWYKGDEIFCGVEAPTGDGWTQDEDSLDTWFSAGLWTFSTLGWPNVDAPDLKAFHPTDVLETGADILFFWVARMILMTGYFLGEAPFRTVYIHGLVRDGQGRKISKSLGNGIDPLVAADAHGGDALRLALIVGNGPGADVNFSEDKIRAYRKFANKLWNVARFVYENGEGAPSPEDVIWDERDVALLDELAAFAKDIDEEMGRYHYHLASEKLYHFVWDRFAAEIIEESKPTLTDPNHNGRPSRQALLLRYLDVLLKLLHPFAPFVTEEIWRDHPARKNLLMVEKWPTLR
jgi:valyl-tRNA synthetase